MMFSEQSVEKSHKHLSWSIDNVLDNQLKEQDDTLSRTILSAYAQVRDENMHELKCVKKIGLPGCRLQYYRPVSQKENSAWTEIIINHVDFTVKIV